MSNLNFGNKEFLNIQMQVLKNAQDIEALKGRPLLEIKFVEELPETGLAGVLYLVPMDPDPDAEDSNSYDEYVWTENGWELIGSTPVDISNMVTTDTAQDISGAKTFTSDITLYAETGDSPSIIFQRGELADAYNDWQVLDKNGYLQFNQDSTVKFYMKGNALVPGVNSSIDLGEEGGYFKEAKANKYTVAASGYGFEKDGSDLRINTGADIKVKSSAGDNSNVYIYPHSDTKLSLGKSNMRLGTVNCTNVANDYSSLQIKGKSGITFTCDNGSNIAPSTSSQVNLGSGAAFWNALYTDNVYFGGNTRINKDASNRINLCYNGNAKIKVGNTETYFVNHVEPDTSDTYDLGRSAMYWRNAYIKNIVNGDGNTIATNDLVTKPNYDNPNVWASGKLASGTGSATIDYTEETGVGVPDWGLYMFTYGNAQCYVAFTESMWLGMLAGYPIRIACPCLEEAGGVVEGNTGNLKIEKTSTTGIIKVTVASTVTGSATSTNGWDFQFIKVM